MSPTLAAVEPRQAFGPRACRSPHQHQHLPGTPSHEELRSAPETNRVRVCTVTRSLGRDPCTVGFEEHFVWSISPQNMLTVSTQRALEGIGMFRTQDRNILKPNSPQEVQPGCSPDNSLSHCLPKQTPTHPQSRAGQRRSGDTSVRQRFRKSLPRNPVYSTPHQPSRLWSCSPRCQAMATSRSAGSVGPWPQQSQQASQASWVGREPDSQMTGSDGTGPAGHVFLSTSSWLFVLFSSSSSFFLG